MYSYWNVKREVWCGSFLVLLLLLSSVPFTTYCFALFCGVRNMLISNEPVIQ